MIYKGIYEYITHVNTTESLHAWEGEHTVLFLPHRILDPLVAPILHYTDQCIQLYRYLSGHSWPTGWHDQFPGKAALAVVQHTCGAGCGSQGKAEILWSEHVDAVRRIGSLTDPLTWMVGFYEFGRQASSWEHPTFPFFRALDHTPHHDLIASAFPEYISGQAAVMAGRSLEEQRQTHYQKGYHRVPGPLEYRARFLASDWTFQQTLEVDHPYFFRNWPLTSLLTHLDLQFGKRFMEDLFAYLDMKGRDHQVSCAAEIVQNLREAAQQIEGALAVDYLSQAWRLIP